MDFSPHRPRPFVLGHPDALEYLRLATDPGSSENAQLRDMALQEYSPEQVAAYCTLAVKGLARGLQDHRCAVRMLFPAKPTNFRMGYLQSDNAIYMTPEGLRESLVEAASEERHTGGNWKQFHDGARVAVLGWYEEAAHARHILEGRFTAEELENDRQLQQKYAHWSDMSLYPMLRVESEAAKELHPYEYEVDADQEITALQCILQGSRSR